MLYIFVLEDDEVPENVEEIEADEDVMWCSQSLIGQSWSIWIQHFRCLFGPVSCGYIWMTQEHHLGKHVGENLCVSVCIDILNHIDDGAYHTTTLYEPIFRHMWLLWLLRGQVGRPSWHCMLYLTVSNISNPIQLQLMSNIYLIQYAYVIPVFILYISALYMYICVHRLTSWSLCEHLDIFPHLVLPQGHISCGP